MRTRINERRSRTAMVGLLLSLLVLALVIALQHGIASAASASNMQADTITNDDSTNPVTTTEAFNWGMSPTRHVMVRTTFDAVIGVISSSGNKIGHLANGQTTVSFSRKSVSSGGNPVIKTHVNLCGPKASIGRTANIVTKVYVGGKLVRGGGSTETVILCEPGNGIATGTVPVP